MWRYVVLYKFIDVSEERAAFAFRNEKKAELCGR
jgi:hypothetical protein